MKPILKVQGDVYFVKVEELPQHFKTLNPEKEGYVLARGEATGHVHVIEDIENVSLYESDGTLYLRIESPVPVKHPEHKPISLDRGIWRVGIQREYDYFNFKYPYRNSKVSDPVHIPNSDYNVRPIRD